MDSIEEIIKLREKVLKYILYKKRTENEIRNKFKSIIEEDTLEDIIEYFKNNGYINDKEYIEKAVNEYMNLKNLSIKEIEYKLYSKGINRNLIEDYIQNNYDIMNEYEKKSAETLKLKKGNTLKEIELKQYLLRKGYKGENI